MLRGEISTISVFFILSHILTVSTHRYSVTTPKSTEINYSYQVNKIQLVRNRRVGSWCLCLKSSSSRLQVERTKSE